MPSSQRPGMPEARQAGRHSNPLPFRNSTKDSLVARQPMTLRAAVLIGCVRAATGAMGVRGVRRATVHASASSAAKPAVLWLHGLGDTGAGWQGAFGPLAAAATFHHPTAPTAPVTINGGMQSTSWMDLKTFPVDLSEPEAGADFEATVASVHAMLEQIEAEGTPAEQILIGGFSQGGATSLAAGLAYPRRLAGIVSISGWAAYRKDFASRVHAANSAVPVLFTCGTADPVVDYSLTKRSGEMVAEALGEAVSGATTAPRSFTLPELTKPSSRPSPLPPPCCVPSTPSLSPLQASVKDFERGMHQPDQSEMRAVHEFIAATLSLKGV